jgi:xanthine dehydrogenase accessory factor
MKQWRETGEVLDFLARMAALGRPAALATVVQVRGSAYRREGAKLAASLDGQSAGNVSGGCLEQDVREVARRVIQSGRPEIRSYCSSGDEIAAWDLGVGCEGQVEILVEPAGPRPVERNLLDGEQPFSVCTVLDPMHQAGQPRLVITADRWEGDLGSPELNRDVVQTARERSGLAPSGMQKVMGSPVFFDLFQPPPLLLVCGAGDDARPLAELALGIGFRVVVADRRPGHLLPERFVPGVRLVRATGEELASQVALHDDCYAVVMTHNYADDLAYLRLLRASPVPYLGVLGPRQRTDRMLSQLESSPAGGADKVYGPVGLDLGTEGAEQVAIAVIAEILSVRSGRPAASLRRRSAPIHAPVP